MTKEELQKIKDEVDVYDRESLLLAACQSLMKENEELEKSLRESLRESIRKSSLVAESQNRASWYKEKYIRLQSIVDELALDVDRFSNVSVRERLLAAASKPVVKDSLTTQEPAKSCETCRHSEPSMVGGSICMNCIMGITDDWQPKEGA